MSGTRDDELARTATAAVGTSEPRPEADPLGASLGRYRLERELGQGGMGVVHAAFDPDLERRVALKVLRTAAGSSDARKRLLDEARAMARLQHPNVVTVHEVDSANGRDFVAMEMVDGETLADWMRSARRAEGEIIDAFVAAGRGLAAAHAEGIVHRDFKPHNVLRSRKGRIAVTDFGLARTAELGPADALAETRELKPKPSTPASATDTPSSPLGGNTVTGTLLGTPAYMAPEQWEGGALTPATDQFAFCVALWEALAGERPFKGPTVETLRQEVARGPAKLDASKIPRRLRPALLRGLDPDPARRWPSMDALLAAMGSGERASRTGYVLAGAALAAGVAVLAVLKVAGGAGTAAPACRAPLQTLEHAWTPSTAAGLRAAGQGPAADVIDVDARAWTAARAKACALPDVAQREPQLACLDGVLARLAVVARGIASIGAGQRHVEVGFLLIDPAVCAFPTPPRLAQNTTPQMTATIAAVFADAARPGRTPKATVQQITAAAQGDPCAIVYATYIAIKTATSAEREPLLAEATEAAERCADDRVRAEFALANAELALESGSLSTTITSKVKLAELAAQRVMQDDILANLEALRGTIARRADQLDEAIARTESAMQHYASRGRIASELAQALKLLDLEQTRGTPEDLVALTPRFTELAQRARERLGPDDDTVRDIERSAGDWQWRTGDPEGAFQRIQAAYRPRPNDPARALRGKVIAGNGAPVAGARVAAGRLLNGTTYGVLAISDSTRFATTGPDGTFEIPDATEFGTIVAEAGGLRSLPQAYADDVTLQLGPTGTISGRVDLHGEPYQSVIVIAIDPDAPTLRFGWASAVAPDGAFAIGGVPRKKLRLFPVVARNAPRQGGAVEVDGRPPRVENVKIDIMKSKRVVHVVVRSTVGTPLGNAAVLVMPGKQASMTAKQLRQTMSGIIEKVARQIEGEHAPAPVVKVARAGDMFATFTEVPEGDATTCALAFPPDLADPQLGKKIDTNLDKLKLECVPIPDDAEAVVIEAPPFPRLD